VGILNSALGSGGGNAERPKRRENPSFSSSAGGVYRGSKRTCTERARWRLVRGQPAQRLSVHYQLECDYGTSTLGIYNDGDAVFLCEGHLSAVQSPRDNCIAGVRPVELDPIAGENSVARADAPSITEILEGLSQAAASSGSGNPPAVVDAAPDAARSAAAAPREAVLAGEAVAEAPTPDSPKTTDTVALQPVPTDTSAAEVSAPEATNQAQEQRPAVVPTMSAAPATPGPAEPAAAPKSRRALAIPTARSAVRDREYGNSAKALVDETIWNMAPGDMQAYRSAIEQGKTVQEAAQAAGGQMAVVHRKIAEYAAKLEPVLSASQATISVAYAIDKPLEQAMLEIIGSTTMDEAAKDQAVEQLGTLQKQIKGGIDAPSISPLQAHRIARTIGEAANWGGASELPEQLKPAYRAVYSRMRDALRAFVPEARELDERLANLYAAKSDIEGASASKPLHACLT
jgi:hypothetical protein